jgi:hypothetical protein
MEKSAPKFPTNDSLGAVDLDNEIIGTCKPQERGGMSVQLFCHKQIRHRHSLHFVRKFVGKQSRLAEYDAGGFATMDPDGTISGAVTLSFSRDAATKLAH